MRYGKFILFGSALTVLFSCTKEEVPEPDLGYTYFPTAVGAWVEYQVDSMWRDDRTAVRDSVSYRLLQKIEAEYTDDEGRLCQRIHRYVKDVDDTWVVRDVWTATRNNMVAEMTEENERRLKLSFPVREGRTWDMNVYNTVPELSVAFREVGTAWVVNGLSFPLTVRVVNTVPPNAVIKRNFEERYADGVGMVSKYWEETNTQASYPPPTFEPVVEVKGWRLDMVAVAYGTE